jgi:hypothetical protein
VQWVESMWSKESFSTSRISRNSLDSEMLMGGWNTLYQPFCVSWPHPHSVARAAVQPHSGAEMLIDGWDTLYFFRSDEKWSFAHLWYESRDFWDSDRGMEIGPIRSDGFSQLVMFFTMAQRVLRSRICGE